MTSRSTDRAGRSDAVATRSDAATSHSDAVGADNAETQPQNRTPEEKLAFAKAALALAGHEVTDLALRNILEQQACGNLTGEQARAAIRKHVQG
ncbi:MAG: hypothetical protein KHY37_03275 [Actinomyces graevenitzii]|jgi:hypothetical protein|uniref:Antitoxin VbhA domain-containing protein n=1 Tax=Actinomyces graevenitzii TaxID=55565 RepID=A0A9E7DC09_9ACTO|nr:hypothetical protein [Actinomyces graevenitzii]UQF79366.1 MAG: hypothetical protein M3I41_07185 [Actinomyces graevenitzii]